MKSEGSATKSCFVVMPFGARTVTQTGTAPWTELYEDHINPTIVNTGLRCFRADEIVRPGSIIADVVRAVAESFLVVAEMTGQNANVFYELGVRHALSLRTILLAQSTDDIPFDLRDCRTIVYDFTPRGARQLEANLRSAVAEVLAEPDHWDNPVQTYLQSIRNGRAAAHDPSKDLDILGEIASLRRRNEDLWSGVEELKRALLISGRVSLAGDLVGTWIDDFYRLREEKFFFHERDLLLMAYGGRWPGCGWGRFDGEVYRFKWSRFDMTNRGNGVLRLTSPVRLEGGLWFGPSAGGDEQPIERHVLTRASLELPASSRELIDRALDFYREAEGRGFGVLDSGTLDNGPR